MTNFPALHHAMEQMRNDRASFQAHVAEAFEHHTILNPPDSKAWFIGKSTTWTYAFRVVWLPGNLHLSGDLGELAVTHYHAMPTWDAAVDWVSGADFHYLMEKSDAKDEFNQRRTAMEMVRMAEDYYEECDDSGLWTCIFEYLDGALVPARLSQTHGFFDPEVHLVSNELDRKLAASMLVEEVSSDLTPETVYNTFQIPDFGGIYDYPVSAQWHYEALQLWAKLVKNSTEYRQIERKKNVQSVS